MKKIFLILLFTSLTFGQSPLLILMGDDGYSYDADVKTYLSALSTPLSDEQSLRLDSLIIMVKDSLNITNLSDAFDIFYLFANETEEASLLNLVKRSHDVTAEGSPTFTQWQGFTGANGKWLNTHYTPSSEGVKFTISNASVGIYSRTNSAEAVACIANATGAGSTHLYIRHTAGNFYGRVNEGTGTSVAVSTSLGLFVASLTDSLRLYQNGLKLATALTSPTTMDTRVMTIIREGTVSSNYSLRQYSAAFMGRGLTDAEVSKLNNCIEWYMDRLGTGVE